MNVWFILYRLKSTWNSTYYYYYYYYYYHYYHHHHHHPCFHLYTSYREFTIINLKRSMFLRYTVLQLFCIYNLCYM